MKVFKNCLSSDRFRITTLTLFVSRLLAELGVEIGWPLWSILGAVVGLMAGYGIGLLLIRRTHHDQTWPIFILWAYILYPAYNLNAALLVGLAASFAWLIVHFPRPKPQLLDGAVFAIALTVYWLTLARGLLPADAGEFQLVAARLGVAHPPGYPLYTMLGKLFTLLIPHNPLRGLNLFSAITAALTVTITGRAARKLSGSSWSGLAASLVLAFAASFWSTAAQASIRPLTAFFTALCVERLVTYKDSTTQSNQTLAGFGLAFALGLTHHPSLAFPGIFFAIYLLLIDFNLIRQPRRWPVLIGAFALGFLPWLYFPIRGSMGAILAPDGLATWQGFWNHVLARGFSGDLFVFNTPAELWDRLLIWLNILSLQWNPVILIAAAVGAVILAWCDWKAFVLLGGGFLLHSLITMTYRAPQTVEYLIPAYVLLAIMLGAGLSWIGAGQSRDLFQSSWARSILPLLAIMVVAITLTASLAQFAQQWPSFAVLAQDDSTREYAEMIFEEAPLDAVVLSLWHWYTPMLTLQEIEGQRPDLDLIYVYPDGAEPLAETWLRRIEEHIGERPVIVTGYFPATYDASPYFFEPLGEAWLVRESPRQDMPPDMEPREIAFDNGLTLVGVDAPPPGSVRVGETFDVRLAWRIDAEFDQDITAYVHFSRLDGFFISGSDRPLPSSRAEIGDVLIERYTVGVPPYALPSPEGEYLLISGLYSVTLDGQIQQYTYAGRFLAFNVEPDPTIVLPPIWPAPTAHPRNVIFANGARLAGFDWEGGVVYLHSIKPDGTPQTFRTSAEGIKPIITEQIAGYTPRLGPWGIPAGHAIQIPAAQLGDRYVPLGQDMVLVHTNVTPADRLNPGGEVIIDLTLSSARPLLVDDVVKVDLIGEGYAWHDQSDHIPATGALPTLKWLWGWQVVDRHRLSVPIEADPQIANAEMLVYDHFTGQMRPLLDIDLAAQGISVPLYTWQPKE